MTFEVSFKIELNPEQRETFEKYMNQSLNSIGLEPKALSISLREQPDFIPAVAPATVTEIPKLFRGRR